MQFLMDLDSTMLDMSEEDFQRQVESNDEDIFEKRADMISQERHR